MFRMNPCFRPLRAIAAPIFAFFALSDNVLAQQVDLPAICDAAAVQASQATGVPVSVLKAISLNETGRKANGAFRPWPWTVNMEGKGVWFDTQDEARAYVYKHFKEGARSFDVGCFQINYKWHHEGFSSLDQMFEPAANALYAARFLADLYAEHGSWTKAAGAYHSRTPERAERYAARFDNFRKKLTGSDAGQTAVADEGLGDAPFDARLAAVAVNGGDIPDLPEAALLQLVGEQTALAPRVNRYPLLQVAAVGGDLGSLVPINGAASNGSLFPMPTAME